MKETDLEKELEYRGREPLKRWADIGIVLNTSYGWAPWRVLQKMRYITRGR